jgi:ubiquinone/menaquinone biosynthesis C-methylase UbiE
MSENQIHPIAASGFSSTADIYAKARPDYPLEFVQLLIKDLKLNQTSKVLELGAGTGKFTKVLSSLVSSKITAVEPLKEMRQQFKAILPEIEILEGTAEKIPTESQSFDVVFVAQAFHWFRWIEAFKEFHRVLKQTGSLILVCYDYEHDPEKLSTRPWLIELYNLLKPYEANVPNYDSQKLIAFFKEQALFSTLVLSSYSYTKDITLELLLEQIASYGFIASLPQKEKESVLESVRDILSTYSTPDDLFSKPYKIDFFICQKNESHQLDIQ